MGNWLDRITVSLAKANELKDDQKAELLKMLEHDYREEIILSRELEAEAKHLPYAHLQKEAFQLAEEERRHAEEIAKLIRNLNGNPDLSMLENYQPLPDGQFTEILKIESELELRYAEHSNYAEDYGFRHEARVLREIKEEHYRNIEQIERIIMRLNATL